ncbi:MAG: PAS domain S-box protein [Clostridia bacterium]|nr:PAS domain S-box protein [Clostridia bacterium]
MQNDRQFTKGKKAEREFLSIALESIGDGVITTDENGRVVFMNEAAEELTGWSRTDADGKRLEEVFVIIDKKSGSLLESPFTVTLRKGSKSGLKNHTVLISKHGTESYISASSAPIKECDGEIIGVVVVFRDITRIKQAEEEVANEQKNLKAIFESSPVGMLLLDENMIICRINDSALKILKRGFEDVISRRIGIGFNCINCIRGNNGCGFSIECDNCLFWSIVSVAFDSGEPIKGMEISHYIFVDGKEENIWLKMSAVPVVLDGRIYVVLAIEDITENKRNEEGLKRYQILSEKARDIIYFIDTDGNILEANDAAFKAYGYTREELLSKSVFELRNNEEIPQVAKQLKIADAEGTLFETEHIRKDGSVFPVEVSAQGTTIGNKRVILSIIRDITERKKAERELQLAMEAAETASRAKSEFLANMSHEIRTPLNGIIGMTDLTLLTELTKDQKENLVTIKTCADTLHRVINDILDLSKIEAGKMLIESIQFDIRELIEKTVKPHYTNARLKGLKFIHNVNKEVPETLMGDPTRLQQILNNLIGNAVKFTEAGEINIQVDNYLIIDSRAYMKFSISDTGIGIAQEEMSQLFKNFSQVDGSITRKYGGTGLGLAISKHLVEMMGGTIWLKSEKGKGSTFYFTIEFSVGSMAARAGSISGINSLLEKTENTLEILMAEDDKVNQILTTQILEKKGHRVDIANNGAEALKKLSEKNYDAILMDIQMPELDGIETTRRIRAAEEGTDRHVPIIALTAFALEGDRERFISAGMDYYVSKPVSMEELLKPLEQLGESKYGDNAQTVVLGNNNAGSRIKNIENKLKEHKKLFIHDIRLHMKRLRVACEKHESIQIERYAHLIKISASGAEENTIKNIAFKIELAARKEDWVQIGVLLINLEEETGKII